MEKEIFKYYKLLGEINDVITTANSFDEVFKEALKLLINNSTAKHAVLWYADNKGYLHPNYSICPIDLTLEQYKIGEGIVGEVFVNSKAKIFNNFNDDQFPDICKKYSSLKISSYLCSPVFDGEKNVGVIEIFKDEGVFNDDELNVLQMIPSLAAIRIKANDKFFQTWKPGKQLFKISNIQKSFKNGEFITNVLKGINLDIYEGEFVVLLGESGCGKSTLLNIIGGMDKPDEGSIIFKDIDLATANENELTTYRRNNIGFVFQSYNLMPNLNARENVKLIAELVKDPMDSDEALKLVGLFDKRKNYPSQLSGGQQQRVSIARALVKRPTIIMADEPTAALDYSTSIEVLSTLSDVCKNGSTLLMVTHNEEIAKMADRVIKLRDGRIFEITVNRNPLDAKQLVW